MQFHFKPVLIILFAVTITSCNNENGRPDASGTFEAEETIVSAEASGKLMEFNVDEGDILEQGQIIGFIDSTQLHLTRLQLLQNQKAILSGRPAIQTQLEALRKELDNAISDRNRIENLVKGQVASQKQLDDANTRVAILQSRIEAQQSVLQTTSTNLSEQAEVVELQLKQVEDQLRKCRLVNPLKGTVLANYVNAHEMVAAGKPMYKIADLSEIILRAYITGDQFAKVVINQKVKVITDDGQGSFKETDGVISWINDKAEFTPKTIQTKDERANLVYAIKVRVSNDGTYKIGMYGELKF